MKKRIRLFLDGYLNYSTAQNLNDLAVANYINKEQFDVYSLRLHGVKEMPQGVCKEVKMFTCRYPFKITQWVGFLWGVWHADIVYVNRIRDRGIKMKIIQLLKKKVFTHVEENFTPKYISYFKRQFRSEDSFYASWQQYAGAYALTQYMRDKARDEYGIELSQTILQLGSEVTTFLDEKRQKRALQQLVFVGRLMTYKGILFVCDLAQAFTHLTFHIVGDGDDKKLIEARIKKDALDNIVLHGKLSHEALASLYRQTDLFVFPSGAQEGFPKVLLECSAAGVPFLTNRSFGAQTWSVDKENAFLVDDNSQMVEVIKTLEHDSELLYQVSKSAIEMAKTYDWKVVIKTWEAEIKGMVKAS